MIATRPIVRVVTSQQPINNFTELFTQYNTYNPREDKQLATKFQQATQQINGNQLIIWIQSNVDSNRQRQLHLYAQIWAYPKVIQNNPVLYDTQHDKLPEDLDGCQMITKAIVLCPYSE